MAESQDLLLEIGAEELPPKALRGMAAALGHELGARLDARGLLHGEIQVFATPRRIAALVGEVPLAQSDREVERRGPNLKDAFDAQGKPTPAAQGFARSCGVEVGHLQQIATDKGTQLAFRTTEVGEATAALLPGVIEEVIARLPMPRRMRWADLDVEFARPVQWVVLLHGGDLIDANILGINTGRMTRGHRFHHPEGIRLDTANEYAMSLYSAGHVVADADARMEMIRAQVDEAAAAIGGTAVMDPDLLEETTALVEWPVAVTGNFDEAFLRLPAAVIMAPMKGHQRYFPVCAADGSLLPHFITISNIESSNPQSVQSGNERVLRARLADAAFFYDADLKLPLQQLQAGLDGLIFQDKLGTMAQKAERVAKLAGVIAIAMGQDTEGVKLARRAGALSKCDLLTQMVGEFPELQGVMGREYAINAGEPTAVSEALAEAYRPRFAGDAVPQTDTGRAVAIADKLDTLVGIFGIGNKPTGDKDPFALRRAALGVLRVIIENALSVNLRKLLDSAVQGYDGRLSNEQTVEEVNTFMLERLRGYFADKGVASEVYAAVQARNPVQPYDFARRVEAVHAFYQMPQAQALAAANKRIQNILRQVESAVPTLVNDELFKENAEWDLAAKLMGIKPRVQKLLSEGNYKDALAALAGLREPVDGFFNEVKVMDDDDAVKNNRLAILASIHELFIETADISRLQA